MEIEESTALFIIFIIFIIVSWGGVLFYRRKKRKDNYSSVNSSDELENEHIPMEIKKKNGEFNYSKQTSDDIYNWCIEQNKIFSFKFCPNCGKGIIQLMEVGKLEHGKCLNCEKEFLIEEILKIKKGELNK